MMQPRKMLISIVFCVLMWNASQVTAWYPYHSSAIQPSPSVQASGNDFQSTPSMQTKSKLSRGHCSHGQVACRNYRQCIPAYWDCDNIIDCSDGSDEDHCNHAVSTVFQYSTIPVPPISTQVSSSSQIVCQYYQFRCNNGYQCVYQYYLCDGWNHCSDGSDEWYWNCVTSSIQPSSTVNVQVSESSQITCGYYQFRCNNGYQCVHQYYLCDGRYHCFDGSDEWYYNCVSSFIQPSSTVNVQVPSSSQITCGYYQFRCNNGYQCVYQYYLCDGRYQCSDGSDEWYSNCASSIQPSSTVNVQATQTVCPYWQFRCNNGYECVDRYYLCNGWNQCSDGSDEWYSNCGMRSSAVIQPSATEQIPTVTPSVQYCSYRQFQCRNGQCIDRSYVCDGRRNCYDGSDEDNCNSTSNVTICEHKIDLGFILDNSGSVGQHNFERMKLFVKDLTDFYKLGPDETRVSVMSFSDSANIHIAFSAYFSDKKRLYSAVDNILYIGGGTATAMALNMAYNNMFTSNYGARGSEFKKVLVILTDGQSNTGQVSGPARQLKNSGVVIFSVGIGQSLSLQELRVMASDPVDQHVITLDNFSQLDRLAEQMSSKTCNASNFQVFCDNDYMTAVFDRADLPKHVNIDRLYLRSRYCRADWNSTHVIVKTPLTGCGTVFSKNDQTLFFSNVLSEEGNSRGVGVITRDYLFKANLTCTYPRKRTVGSFSFAPAKERLFVNVAGQGNFTLIMDVFKDRNYRQPYTSQDYPVFKSLSDNLYIQYSINSSNPNLVVRAETCRATPTNRPYDTPQYVFIADGCDKDETIRHYTSGMGSVQRFSMQAFRFLSEHRFVYLHCDFVVCYRYDYNSTCARSTSCPRRYRRDVDQPAEDVSGMYPLSFGPVMKGKESADKNVGADSKASNITLIGSLIGFGCLILVLIGALLFMIQRSRNRRSDQTQVAVDNKVELSMQNLGYT